MYCMFLSLMCTHPFHAIFPLALRGYHYSEFCSKYGGEFAENTKNNLSELIKCSKYLYCSLMAFSDLEIQ